MKGKCELITDDLDVVARFRQTAPNIMHVLHDDAVLLYRSTCWWQCCYRICFTGKTVETQVFEYRLSKLHAHDAFYLLIHCFSMPKLLYTLLSAPCFAYDSFGTVRLCYTSVVDVSS
jgi:hypothetical protein